MAWRGKHPVPRLSGHEGPLDTQVAARVPSPGPGHMHTQRLTPPRPFVGVASRSPSPGGLGQAVVPESEMGQSKMGQSKASTHTQSPGPRRTQGPQEPTWGRRPSGALGRAPFVPVQQLRSPGDTQQGS